MEIILYRVIHLPSKTETGNVGAAVRVAAINFAVCLNAVGAVHTNAGRIAAFIADDNEIIVFIAFVVKSAKA